MSPPGPPVVPSRNALRVLRRLALAGSTVGSFCTVAAITYDVNRRVSVAERIVENKRAIQTSAPRYDATSAARRLSLMMEAAEAGEFQSLEAWREEEKKAKRSRSLGTATDPNSALEGSSYVPLGDNARSPVTTRPYSNDRASMEVIDFVNEVRGRKIEPLQSDSYQLLPSPPPLPNLESLYAVRDADSESPTATEQDALCMRMRELFGKRKYIDAAQIFLESHPASVKGISSERREAALQAFYLNCRQGNVFIARSVFERLEEVDRVSPTMWKILIITLAKKGCIEESFTLPAILLTSAKWLLTRNLSLDRDCGLCAAYLGGLWKKTRSIELLNSQFWKLLTMLRRLDKNVTAKIVTPMLKAYVEIGKFSDAEALVHEMTTTYCITPICWTKGYLAYGKALQCDWAAVNERFEEMHDLGLTKEKVDFVRVFDRVFLEYWPAHTSDEIRDFIYSHIDRFEINPDQLLYNHILEAIVEKGDETMVPEFMDMARQRGWKVNINDNEFLDTLLRRRAALEESPVGFWQMLKAARQEHMRATASQKLLGHDRRSFEEKIARVVEGAEFPDEWHKRTLNEITQPTRGVDHFQRLNKVMIYFMHVGNMTEALARFQRARDNGKHIKPLEVELALIATLLEHGLDEARALIQDDWYHMLPIFFRQIKTMEPSSEAEVIKMAIFRFYQLCWVRNTMVVKHHITASTSHRLIASDRPQLAIDLLVSVYMSKYGRLKALDGVCMKMFIRAFAARNNMYGMRWCILTAIARGSALNADFVAEVERLLPAVRRKLEARKMRHQERVRMGIQLDLLDYAATVLRGKSSGAPEFAKLRVIPKFKQSFRREIKGRGTWKFIWTTELPQLIERWDEEYELERVLGRIDEIGHDKEMCMARWNEITCQLRRRVHHDADVVIVGAGVLGCALAVALGRQGRSVLLLEQSLKEPDRIVGELLQPGGVNALEQLGLRDCLEGIEAIPTEGYYVSYLGRPVTIPYPVQSPGASRPEGRSFHHGRFVMKLREAARACPNVTLVETKVTDLITFSQNKQVLGVECVTKEKKDCYFGQVTVVADGYASKFRKQYHPYTPKVRSKFWGLELIDAELPQPHYGHVLLNPNSPPILVYQIGTHETRILCDIPENLPSASVKNGGVKGHLRNTVLPSLPKSIQPSFAAALDKNQLRSMPNSFLPSATNKTPGLIVLGDALNMRHPLTGGGMTVALNDVVILRDLLSPEKVPKLSDSALVLKQLSAFHWRRKMGASVINVLAQALYSLFAADDDNLKALQRGCFRYFEMGMYNQPVSLLGGMLKKPQVLFAHFFTVAFLSLWMIIRESPIYALPLALIRCIFVFWTACVVILPYMLIEAFC
ncbi:squalene epoxidase-domain-containing protein [Aspergillus undulatus]|uniref:squalene epoxidase-domain-containing protein n=1 Tax=Aspergillus undulatus TaxID=1810928 RepID=UPI003CCCAA6D